MESGSGRRRLYPSADDEGDFLRTALAIRAVAVYGSPAQDREIKSGSREPWHG